MSRVLHILPNREIDNTATHMPTKLHIPIKYKFLAVLLLIMLSSLSAFFFFAQKTFSEDKKLFVMDLNLTLLKAATSEIQLELKGRLEEIAVLVPRIYGQNPQLLTGEKSPFVGLSSRMSEDVLQVHIYRRNGNKFETVTQFRNVPILEVKGLEEDFFREIDRHQPLDLSQRKHDAPLELVNRSLSVSTKSGTASIPILSVILGGNIINNQANDLIVVVDLLQDFLRKKLQQSEIAELFLITKKGGLLAHSMLSPIIDYAKITFPHPVVERLALKQFPRESLELDVGGEPYLLNLSETGFPGVFAVSQIKKSEAFHQLHKLMRQSILLALLILSVALIFSTLFAAGLTSNIQKLKEAAENIGSGHLKTEINIHSNDEVQLVADSFRWMSGRLAQLIAETAQKARMEEELATAKLVQSTILTNPAVQNQSVDVTAYYSAASECGGDFWDCRIQGDTLTALIGDATGHGAPAAIVTAVAKSCFTTLDSVYTEGSGLSAEQIMQVLNQVIHRTCKGQLLITMCLVQIDLRTGELLLCNAGHESPMCLRSEAAGLAMNPSMKKTRAEVLFARGERLGFSPDATYEAARHQLKPGDTLLLYTDGISEARDFSRKEWGERNLNKAFASKGIRPLSEMKKQIVEAMESHARGAKQEDDVTFVLVSWNPGVAIEHRPIAGEQAVWKSGAAPNTQRKLTTLPNPERSEEVQVAAAIINELPQAESLWEEQEIIAIESETETNAEPQLETETKKGPKAA